MAHNVGSKGDVDIEKEIRDRLGVQSGWQDIQMLMDGRVEIYFLPPEHRRSLKGCLRPYIHLPVPPEDSWGDLVAEAVGAEFRDRNTGLCGVASSNSPVAVYTFDRKSLSSGIQLPDE